jgi:hypothetical protein
MVATYRRFWKSGRCPGINLNIDKEFTGEL